MLTNKAVILAKVETTYGTDAAPLPANAILCSVPKLSPIVDHLERNNIKPYMGKLAGVNVGRGLKIEFDTEVRGSGTAGTAPDFGVLFRGCNFTETIVASTSVAYDPNSATTNAESLTIYFYIDGILHKLMGARGSWKLNAKSGGYASITWSFTGLFAGPADTAIVSPTYTAVVPAAYVAAQLAIGGYTPVFESLSIDCGGEVVPHPDANHATGNREFFIKDRPITGSIDPDMTLVAANDWWAKMAASTLQAFTSRIGSVAGNICTITGPKVSFGALGYGDRNGIMTVSVPLTFSPDGGNDEIKLSFT